MYSAAMTYAPSGHIEQLPSGSWRAKVYAGKDPLSGREIRFRKTRRTEVEAQIELGKLLELARSGRQPDSDITVVELLDAYVPVAGWDVSTLETNLGYVRRTIKPALGIKEVRKVRGPLLDNLYARLQRCGNLACGGKPFTEHRHVPDLRPDPSDPRMEWEQAADRLQEAIASGALASGDALPSVPELARLQGLKPGTRAGSRCLRPPGLWRCRIVAMALRRIPVTRESGPGDHPGGLVHNHGTRRSPARQPYLAQFTETSVACKALPYLRPKGRWLK
jgi:hypothetical protein